MQRHSIEDTVTIVNEQKISLRSITVRRLENLNRQYSLIINVLSSSSYARILVIVLQFFVYMKFCLYQQKRCWYQVKQVWLKGRLQRIPKPISNQNLFSRFQLWCLTFIQKMKSKDQAILKILCEKNQAIYLAERTLGLGLKSQTVKLLEMTESICCFYRCLSKCRKTAL